MPNEAVAIAAIVMSGVFLSVVAWQLLGIARSAVARQRHDRDRQVHTRLQALEELHHTDGLGDSGVTPRRGAGLPRQAGSSGRSHRE